MKNKVLLGIDYGTKRVGLALKPAGSEVIFGWGVLKNEPQLLSRIAEVVKKESVEVLVVGLPCATDGSATHMTVKVREFMQALRATVPQEVVGVDERFTTAQALRESRMSSISSDERAASFIVEQYVDKHS